MSATRRIRGSRVLGARATVAALLACAACLQGARAATENLVSDCSLESALPLWFAERSGTSYYAAKESVSGAADGQTVLAIAAWDRRGSRILSPPFALASTAGLLSGTVSVRSFGRAVDATVELSLFAETGAKKLASFGQIALDGSGTWRRLAKQDVRVDPALQNARLGIVFAGAHEGVRLELDRFGLFAGHAIGPTTDNSDLAVLEAEQLADGQAWQAAEHYTGWYRGTPSAGRMLAGFQAVKPGDNRPASRSVEVRRAGPHLLAVRFLAGSYAGRFTVALRQKGATVVEKEFVENVPQYGRQFQWVWDTLRADLQAGPAEIVLTRPAAGASWVTRKIDLLVLTNRTDYVPRAEDFSAPGYLRFTPLAGAQSPFCLYLFVRRHEGPRWYANPGILSLAGLSEGYSVPADTTKWLAPGLASPWVRITDYLLAAGGRNNVQLVATRKSHVDGFAEGRIHGRLEFAVGPKRTIIKTVEVDQQAPRLLMTLPLDLDAQRDTIKTASDYVSETEAEVARLGPIPGSPARWLNLATNLGLRDGLDDPQIVRREVEILKWLGFNQTYYLAASPERAVAFSAEHDLLARFGAGPRLWTLVRDKSQHHPDAEAMDRSVAKFADENRPILDRIVRSKFMDEPSGMSYEEIAQSQFCRQKFVEWLKRQGRTPAQLGVASWDQVVPVLPADSQARPELFFYSALFRLEGFATLARACVAAKQKHLPATTLAYVNYSPPTSGGSWTERGTDLFLAHGPGGMEEIWTEDWLGYSIGPQHLSDVLALCRAAGRAGNRRLGAYCVGQGTPRLMRMKYYTLIAGGVRDLVCYAYGPWYAGIDSWGRRFDLYGAIRTCNFEMGKIDAHLEGTRRRPAQVAILYNRTASIWAKSDTSCALNATFTHWALAHAGYDADFLAEEDVDAGRLADYKVFYLDGPQLVRRTAQAIAAWVRSGGVLFGSAAAGTRDEFDRPSDVLETVFGAKSVAFSARAPAGRPKYELRALKPLARFVPASAANKAAAPLEQYCLEERIEPLGSAQPILVDATGRPAGVIHHPGRGTAIRVAALPGVAYAHEAVVPPYDPASYLPQNFRCALRDFIAWPAALAAVPRVATTAAPIAEIVRYDAPGRAVVFVIDHGAQPGSRFTFELPDAAGLRHGLTGSGNPVQLEPLPNGHLRVTLPLDAADAVVLLPEP